MSFKSYNPKRYTECQMSQRIDSMLEKMQSRRSVREFSPTPVPLDVVRKCIQIAGTAPSGSHKQPWTFCLVTDPEIKRQIRIAAEQEEYTNYHGRMSEEWLEDLKPFGTDHIKSFHRRRSRPDHRLQARLWQNGRRQNQIITLTKA